MADEFLGRGWKFPIQVDPSTGRIRLSEYEEDISEAIRIILGTTKGERVMRPSFGSSVREFVFGQTDETTLRLLETSILDAIRKWEHRVENIEVTAIPRTEEPGRVDIRIQYVVRTTNSVYNLVYPYYLQDGAQ